MAVYRTLFSPQAIVFYQFRLETDKGEKDLTLRSLRALAKRARDKKSGRFCKSVLLKIYNG